MKEAQKTWFSIWWLCICSPDSRYPR